MKSRGVNMIIISDMGLIGDALSGVSFIYDMANRESKQGRLLYLFARNKEILTLFTPDILNKIKIMHHIDDFWNTAPQLGQQTIHVLDTTNGWHKCVMTHHMIQSHWAVAGYDIPPLQAVQLDYNTGDDIPTYDFVISPYSRSDHNNNKLWPYDRWQSVINMLKDKNQSVCVTGSDEDLKVFNGVDYFMGHSIRDVAGLLSKARKAVLSVDNGISHLTHFVGSPHFLIYPQCLPAKWVDNPNAIKIHREPMQITTEEVKKVVASFV